MAFLKILMIVVAAEGSGLEKIGDRYSNQGRAEQSQHAYHWARYEDPALAASADFLYRLGRAHFSSRNYEPAAASFKNSFLWATTGGEKADALIGLGRSLFALKDFTGADHYFSQVIKYEPRPSLELLYFFGLTCYEEGKVTDAFNLFQNLYEQAGRAYDRDELRYLLGLCLMKSRNYAGAQFYLEGISSVTGMETEGRWFENDAVYLLALCDYYLGERDKAVDLITAFDAVPVQAGPDRRGDRKTTLLLGTIYLDEKDYNRAIATFGRILADRTDSLFGQAVFRTGYCYYQMGDYRKAVTYFDQLGDGAEEPAIGGRAFFYSGEAYQELGQPVVAAQRYQSLLRRYPKIENQEEVQLRLALAYAAADEHLKAQTEFRNFLTLFPDSKRRTEARYRLAQSLDILQRDDEALENLQQVEADSQSVFFPDAYYLAGSILLNLKRYDEARESFTMVREGPLRPRALKGVGDALFADGKYVPAISAYRQALVSKPDERSADDIRYQIEESYFKMGVYGSELDVLRNFLWKYPASAKSPGLEFELGVQLYEQKNYQSAIGEAERLLRNYPGHELNADALELMGRAYSHLNKVEAAIDAYSRVVDTYKKSPVVPRVLEELGRLYASHDRIADALQVYSRLVRQYSTGDNVGSVLLEMGRLYRRLEEWREAQAVLQRFISQYPKSDLLREVYLELVRVYEGQSDWRSAERLIGDFLEKFGPAGDGYWEWAVIEQSQGKYQQAKELFIRASELYGANRDRSAQSLLEAGICALAAGQTAEAKDLFVRVDILAFDERLRIEAKRRLLNLEQ